MAELFRLDPGEVIIKHIRHHWFHAFKLICLSLVMVFLGLLIIYFTSRFPELIPPFIPVWSVGLIGLIFTFLGGLMVVIGLWVYHRSYMLLTNLHLIQAEQSGLFRSQVDQVSLGRIQDVSGVRPGIIATILNFGDLSVQSAGEKRQFVMHGVAAPQLLADEILHANEQFIREHPTAPD